MRFIGRCVMIMKGSGRDAYAYGDGCMDVLCMGSYPFFKIPYHKV